MDKRLLLNGLKRGLVVSCQAQPGSPLRDTAIMVAMARAAEIAGAVGIRANGTEDITAIRAAVRLPIIGILKQDLPGFAVRITPSLAAAEAVVAAGADILALDGTDRPHPGGLTAVQLIQACRRQFGSSILLMADISMLAEGIAAAQAGADIVGTTLSGYTPYSRQLTTPDFELIAELAGAVDLPVVAEGRIATPEDARRAVIQGAYAVVVGAAITQPETITPPIHRGPMTMIVGAVDIGGTKIGLGVVTANGQIIARLPFPTRQDSDYGAILAQIVAGLAQLTVEAGARLEGLGIGVTGRVNPDRTLQDNNFLPTLGGHDLAGDLGRALGIPAAALENDADAAALGEYLWGTGRGQGRFIFVNVGTGIGGGMIFDGKLYRGAGGCHPEIGHHALDPAGPACFCGAHGCWEQLASGRALAAWAGANGGAPDWDARQICALAEAGEPVARAAVEREGYYLGLGLANLITLFAPDCIALGGGLMRQWPSFAGAATRVIAQNCGLVPWRQVRLTAASQAEPALAGAAAVWLAAAYR